MLIFFFSSFLEKKIPQRHYAGSDCQGEDAQARSAGDQACEFKMAFLNTCMHKILVYYIIVVIDNPLFKDQRRPD